MKNKEKKKSKTIKHKRNISEKAPKEAPAETQSKAVKGKKEKTQQTLTQEHSRKKGELVGDVYRGKTKYIDKETKEERNYVVVLNDGRKVTIAKLKSIKIFDENGKNADKALVEINATRYGLEKRTGVDFQRFDKNRMSGKPLNIEDKEVFPEGEKLRRQARLKFEVKFARPVPQNQSNAGTKIPAQKAREMQIRYFHFWGNLGKTFYAPETPIFCRYAKNSQKPPEIIEKTG